ncbi:MAG: transcriptional regulator [Spartobacteria bacterium]|nr:transcriptional regulator [Spartobacteria bacterium]
MVALTKAYRETVLERIRNDEGYARAVFAEACCAILEGEPHIGLEMLRDLIHATITFKRLAELTGLGEKSLHRMLGKNGNPTLNSLSVILSVIEKQLQIHPAVTA